MVNRKFRWIALWLGIIVIVVGIVVASPTPSETSFVMPIEHVYDIAFHLQGNTLAVASKQGLAFWELTEQPSPGTARQVAGTISAHGPVAQLAWSHDGQFLVTLDGVQTSLAVWDTINPDQPTFLPWPTHGIYNAVIALSPDGSLLAAGGTEDQVYLWNWRDQRLLQMFRGSSYDGIEFSADGHFLSFDWRLWRIDQISGTLAEEINLHTVVPGTSGSAERVAMHPTLPLLAVADTNGALTLVNMETKQIIWSVSTPYAAVGSLVFSPNGNFLVSGGGYREGAEHGDPDIRLWRISDGQLVQTLTSRDLVRIEKITISADNRWIAAMTRERKSLFGGYQSRVRVWPMP